MDVETTDSSNMDVETDLGRALTILGLHSEAVALTVWEVGT
jgi:hypothetical protein